jgi:hypothetical protein
MVAKLKLLTEKAIFEENIGMNEKIKDVYSWNQSNKRINASLVDISRELS